MDKKTALHVHARRIAKRITPAHIVKARVLKRVIQRFADKIGLVYFGYVNQSRDEHRLVRGHTVSATHVDDHYCVGSFKGYDIALVSRSDTRTRPGTKAPVHYHWLILTVDLHASYEVPHLYIGHSTRKQAFQDSFEQLRPLSLGSFGQYPPDFTADYTVYGVPTHMVEIEQIISPQVASVISSHFSTASIEIETNTIYCYIEQTHPTEAGLEKMLTNTLWLAEALDTALMRPVE